MTVCIAPLLSPAAVGRFHREGYLLYQQPVLSSDKFTRLQTTFDGLLRRWQADPRAPSPEHMDVPHFLHPELFEWLLDDAVLDLVEPLLGPNIALFSSHFICKPAQCGKRVPWHEDSWYWRGRLDPMEVVTVWLALDPSTPENGCMRVIPGSQKRGSQSTYESVAGPAVFDSEMKRETLALDQAVNCVLQPNECSLHAAGLAHGSEANRSGLRRCGYTMRYVSTRTRLNVDAGPDDGFRLYLARGRDHAGNNYGDPTRPNATWIAAHPDRFPAGH